MELINIHQISIFIQINLHNKRVFLIFMHKNEKQVLTFGKTCIIMHPLKRKTINKTNGGKPK